MNTGEAYFLITVHSDKVTEEDNESRREAARLHFHNWSVTYKEVWGMSEDVADHYFLVRNPATARLVGILYNQNTYLRVDQGHVWSVLVSTNDDTYLGRRNEVFKTLEVAT